ncbi:MAG: flagellar biosynthesis anti-sigma factor FlgM [Thiobacillus sp.]
MKIDPGMKQVTLPPSVENRPARPQAGSRAETGQTDVSLSQRASQMKQLETQLAAIPVVDQARVDSIKAAIASGQYTIKPENIASSLIDSVKEMLHAAK